MAENKSSSKSKVVLIPCSSYEKETVYQAMKEGLDLLGGISKFVKKEERILIKPNLLKKADPDRPVITHPSFVAAFAGILKEEGYDNLFVADSASMGSTTKILKGTGLDADLEKLGIPQIDYSEGIRKAYPQGVQAKEFIFPKELLEADAVISLSKMKTHALERITGAVKNSYGFIYGRNKAIGHTKYPSADSFARMLIDLNRAVAPRLYLMDGITAMEGNGPTSGDPVNMNLMLLSTDPIALDTVFCYLIHLNPALVPTNYHGEKMGLGNMRSDRITVLTPKGELTPGEAGKKYGHPSFNCDRSRSRNTIWEKGAKVLNLFQKKPYIDPANCIKCGICVRSCPVEGKALGFKNGKDHPPVYNYRKCIRCFCCQEMCPQKAIRVK